MKNQKAITLVALVITIIILLILAGIAINSLTENGLFEKAKLAKERSENAQKIENETLGEYSNTINEYINGSRNESNVQSGRTILWDAKDDPNGPISNAGTADGTSERTLAGNVNDYDAIIIQIASPLSNPPYAQNIYVDKDDYSNIDLYGCVPVSSILSDCNARVGIDNNKVYFRDRGHSAIVITKVIGIKY